MPRLSKHGRKRSAEGIFIGNLRAPSIDNHIRYRSSGTAGHNYGSRTGVRNGKESGGVPKTGPLHGQFGNSRSVANDVINFMARSEEHTSELQSLRHLVCRL